MTEAESNPARLSLWPKKLSMLENPAIGSEDDKYMRLFRFDLRTLLLLVTGVAPLAFGVANADLLMLTLASACFSFAVAASCNDRGFPPLWRGIVTGLTSCPLLLTAAVCVEGYFNGEADTLDDWLTVLPIVFSVGIIVGILIGLLCGLLIVAIREVRAGYDKRADSLTRRN